MKINIFFLFLKLSFSKILYDLDIINLGKYDTIKTNLSNAGICLNIKNINIRDNFYLNFNFKNSSMNETLKYEFLNDSCYSNYIYEPENNALHSKEKSSFTSYYNEFTNEYEFRKNSNLKFLFVIYVEYTGDSLTITFSTMKTKKILYIVLGIFGGFTILLLFTCFIIYKCCKKKLQ